MVIQTDRESPARLAVCLCVWGAALHPVPNGMVSTDHGDWVAVERYATTSASRPAAARNGFKTSTFPDI